MSEIVTETEAARPRLYLIDGSGFIFRAYHAIRPLSRSDGTPVHAVYGFTQMLLSLIDRMKEDPDGDYIAVVFDVARKTFRNRIYEQYKANRPEPPEDLIPQFPLVREATRALNIPVLEAADYEADDLIATYTRLAREKGWQVVIVSSDKDLMQLVGDDVVMYDAMKQKDIGAAQVEEKFGVPPQKVLDVLSLMGDSSDNVPGVPGIGPKTASELINTYGDLDRLLERAAEIKQNKRRENLIEFADQARMSRELITLRDDAPTPLPLEALELKEPQPDALLSFLREQEFKSMIKKFETMFGATDSLPKGEGGEDTQYREGGGVINNYTLVTDEKDLQQWCERSRSKGIVAFDTETTSLDAMQAELVGFSLSIEPGEACYVPLQHVAAATGNLPVGEYGEDAGQAVNEDKAQPDLFADTGNRQLPASNLLPGQIPLDVALGHLKTLLEDKSILKIGQNIKYDMLVLEKYGIGINPLDDTMVLSYVLDAGLHRHNMDELSQLLLGIRPVSYKEVAGSGRAQISFAEVELEKARDYAAEDADITLRLHRLLKSRLIDERKISVYETLERPLVSVLVRMEAAGIRVDPAMLSNLSKDFAQEMKLLESDIFRIAGHEFNIASPKQLGEVLFDELGFAGGKKSGKTGAYSTGAEVLEELAAGGQEIAEKVLSWRMYAKLKSTYTDALAKQINPATGRVHTSYAMAIAATGRLSSTDPNLQNIPVRTAEGRKIRTAFVAAEGCKLLSADYSQIELRLLAHMADIDVLKQAFREGRDIHATTASQMFGVEPDAVDSELRRKAKTINFGIIYGISAHGLAVRLGISRKEAADYIERYFAQYPGIRRYMEENKEFARKHGYVETLYGRRIHITGINYKNPNRRGFAERQAINAPLQGTAADIIKRAMIKIDRELYKKSYSPATMLLQVHDELVFEVKQGEEERVSGMVKKAMELVADISVPLTVDIGIGNNWGEIH